MPSKLTPEVRLIFYPQSTIPFRGAPPFVISDVLGDRMNLSSGDTSLSTLEGQLNPTITDDWRSQGNQYDGFFNVTNLDFVRFLQDGHVREGSSENNRSEANDDIAGWIIRRREALLDSKIEGDLQNDNLNTSYTDLTWRSLMGTHKTHKPPESPQRCCFLNTGNHITTKARTVGDIPANRSVRFDVYALGQDASGPQSAIRVAIAGNKFSIRLAHKERPSFEETINGVWTPIRRLDTKQAISLHGGHYIIRFRRIAGRLVIGINDEHFHFIHTTKHNGNHAIPIPIDTTWPAGPLTVNTYNCRARVGIGMIKYSDASAVPFTGTFSRHCPRKTPVDVGDLTGSATGWVGDGTSAAVAFTVVPGSVDYAVTMTASADGIDTPLINKVSGRTQPEWTVPTATGLDVSHALGKWSVNNAMPPIMPGANASFTINRLLLASGWETYIDKRCPVTFEVRWHYDDGSTGNWIKLFRGYVYQITKSNPGLNQQAMTVSARDPVMRLQKPAAVIDHRYPPLDVLLFEAAANNTAQTVAPSIYGSNLVYEILKIALGPDTANTFNGNSTGIAPTLAYLNRYFDSPHYALLDNNTGGYLPLQALVTGQRTLPTQNGFFFAAPYGSDALDWANSVPAKLDNAILFWGWPGGYDDLYPCPIYGRRKKILAAIFAGQSVITLPDVIPAASDLDRLILMADNESRPWIEYNRILVWANGGAGGNAAFAPAVRMAEYNLPDSDPNSRAQTWESTLIIKEDIGFIPGVAERIGSSVLNEIRGVELQWPVVTCLGYATLQWGSIILIDMSATGTGGNFSDVGLGLNGKYFRVEKVEHSGDNVEKNFETKVYPRPLTNSESAELGL